MKLMARILVFLTLFGSCQSAFAEDTLCLPLVELQNSVKKLEICRQEEQELDLCKQEAATLKAANESLARDYQAEIEKAKQAQDQAARGPLTTWLWFGAGVLATSAAITLAGKLK
jgi:hypothetical protein